MQRKFLEVCMTPHRKRVKNRMVLDTFDPLSIIFGIGIGLVISGLMR